MSKKNTVYLPLRVTEAYRVAPELRSSSHMYEDGSLPKETSLEEYVGAVYSYAFQLKGAKSFHLCLSHIQLLYHPLLRLFVYSHSHKYNLPYLP